MAPSVGLALEGRGKEHSDVWRGGVEGFISPRFLFGEEGEVQCSPKRAGRVLRSRGRDSDPEADTGRQLS